MLTPIDIQNHSLKTAVRGYSKKETDDFLEEILQGYEELYKENRELKDKMASLSEGIQYYKQMETTLQKALVLAEKTSAETQEAAKSKAEAMTSEAQTKAQALKNEAQTKADAILEKAETEAEALRKEAKAYAEIAKTKANQQLEETRNHVRKLVQSYENYRLQFKKLAESQIEMLESENYSIFAPELSEMLDDAPDAEEVMEADKIEAINTLEEETAVEEETVSEDSFAAEPQDTNEISETDEPAQAEKTEEVVEDVEGEVPETDEVFEEVDEASVESDKVSEESEGEDDNLEKPQDMLGQSESYELAEDTESGDSLEDYLEEELKKAQEKLLSMDTTVPDWQSTTPKLDDAEEVETKSVVPNAPQAEQKNTDTEDVVKEESTAAQEDTPFTFIDTE